MNSGNVGKYLVYALRVVAQTDMLTLGLEGKPF